MKKFILIVFIMIGLITIANSQVTKIGGGFTLTNGFQFDGQSASANIYKFLICFDGSQIHCIISEKYKICAFPTGFLLRLTTAFASLSTGMLLYFLAYPIRIGSITFITPIAIFSACLNSF